MSAVASANPARRYALTYDTQGELEVAVYNHVKGGRFELLAKIGNHTGQKRLTFEEIGALAQVS